VILNDRSLQGIDEHSLHPRGKGQEFLFVDEEPTLAVGHGEETVVQRDEIHADARTQAAEQQTAGAEDAPHFGNHGLKLFFATSEVKHGAADDYIREFVWKMHLFNAAYLKVLVWQSGVQRLGQFADMFDRGRVLVDGENLGALPQQIDEISAVTAPCIEDAHAGRDITSEDLIEDIDVNLSELVLEAWRHSTIIACSRLLI
jgi:hypothetical protein